ncbi:predicted protein [Arabidopsis lyrata subsp. lyrata]|uniref:Predicted protein n=1 Tax=Arabidopsis lyrata subsp. lyrata TaxID=81972 RepID=D7KJM0_ARALL|nr:predicted protein [Arabidopsis lyrata subsp. lyrata]EFH53720.1 predicted protein [Arabidopsis lyrata subsp. lyrata]EFH57744.1 predicted protein [Arabidopsis lyrata subsp. lyrata]EFH70667.1 predicted protein [Arabidopsis lyrata subsp. lyrata]
MDSYPYSHGSGFVNLLTSQQEVHNLEANPYDDVPVFPSQADSPSQAAHKPKDRQVASLATREAKRQVDKKGTC